MNPERCHWIRDADGTEVLIPMCIGCAVLGPKECTCDTPESAIEEAQRRRDEAERHVTRLREARDRGLEEQQSAWNRSRNLHKRVRELEAQLEAMRAEERPRT